MGTKVPADRVQLKRAYEPVLAWALGHSRWVLGGAAAVLVLAGIGATRLGSEFIPRLSEGTIVVMIDGRMYDTAGIPRVQAQLDLARRLGLVAQ